MSVKFEENHDHEAILMKHLQDKGFNRVHLCPDWDYMAIHDRSPEFEACTCTFAEAQSKAGS